MNYSLSKCHPESDAVAVLCAWVKLSHLVADVSVSLPEYMWHLTQAFFMVCRTEWAAVRCFLICGIINSGAQSGPFTVHSHREMKRMWKNRFLVQNDQMDWHKIMQFFPLILLLSICYKNLAAWPRLNQKCKNSFSSACRVPALPVKNLTGSGPVHPALAGEINIYQIEHIRKTES